MPSLQQGRRNRVGLPLELFADPWLGAIAAPGDTERERAAGVAEPEMQRREPAHREADDMRLLDPHGVQDSCNIVCGSCLGVGGRVGRDVAGRIAAGIISHRPVAPPEMAELQIPAPAVTGEFMDKDQRCAGSGFLILQAGHRHRWWQMACQGSPIARYRATRGTTGSIGRPDCERVAVRFCLKGRRPHVRHPDLDRSQSLLAQSLAMVPNF